MKKIFYILVSLATLSLLASCQREILLPDTSSVGVILEDPVPGDMAEVTFSVSVPAAGVSNLSTKALTEQPNIASGDIYLALFGLGENTSTGRGGNLQHFLKAKLKDNIVHDVDINAHKYEYSVLLPISDEPFVIDFMVGASDANGDLYTLENAPAVQYEKDFMPNMLSRNGVPGYWQRVVIPKVEPEPNDNGIGYKPSSDGNDYKAKPIEEMQDIQLVRNFGMVTFTAAEGAKFTIDKFVLVDYPKNGDIAPFDASASVGYKTPYMGHNTDYASIVSDTYKYPGYSTIKTLETGIDENPSFTNSGEYSFLYERPAPSDAMPESGAVIRVKWNNTNDVESSLRGQTYFYKVAFTGENGYVPILRNIVYNFQISDFNTPTHPTTAQAAYNGSWLGDISANIATANLDEIANSTSRIVVSEMSKTHIGEATTEANPYKIYFQYYPNTSTYPSEVAVVNNTNFHGKNVKVIASIEPVSGYGPAIKSITQPVVDATYSSEETWGRVDVQTYGSGDNILRSKLKIFCQLDGQTALYREVIFTVMQKQRFNDGTSNSSIDAIAQDAINQQTTLHLRIPSDLPKDLFPLQVRIEAQANNLTSIPVGNVEALPVKYGVSAFDNSKNSFYFVKTINWDDYAQLDGEDYTYTTEFPCYFKTTLDSGNDTVISLQDLTTTKGVNEGKYFYEMILCNGIVVSPAKQIVAYDATSATVRVTSSSAWSLGAHSGLTVADGSPTSGEAGTYDVTFNFAPNNSSSHVSRTATFTSSGHSATATIEQKALVSVTRTIDATLTYFNISYEYTGEFASELGISFTGATGRSADYITIGRQNGGTLTVSTKKITNIVITWYSGYYNYYGSISSTVTGATVSNSGNTSTWTYATGTDSVTLSLAARNNNRDMRATSIQVTYFVEQ